MESSKNPPTPLCGSSAGEALCSISWDLYIGSLGSCCARNRFWCCHNIRPKLGRSLICDIACCFSSLGSLTTVLTWLRSRACAGMQGWALCACVQTGFTQHGSPWLRSRACAGMQGLGVLALVVVAPCGFAAEVAAEEAVLCPPLAIAAAMGSAPNFGPPTSPEPKPLDPPGEPLPSQANPA